MSTEQWRLDNAEKMRKYRRDYYARNRQRHIDNQKAKNVERRAANVAAMNEAKDRPCADCRVKYPPYVMQFDHVGDDKLEEVSSLVWRAATLKRVLAEIAKCEVVCANCHFERTHQRKAGLA